MYIVCSTFSKKIYLVSYSYMIFIVRAGEKEKGGRRGSITKTNTGETGKVWKQEHRYFASKYI